MTTPTPEKCINGLTQSQYQEYFSELRTCPCERDAMDRLHAKYFGSNGHVRYPDEYYADKDNRLNGKPTGGLRYEGGKMVWVKEENQP